MSLRPGFATVARMRTLAMLIVLLLTGCVGSVNIENAPEDSFTVGSATWFEVKTDDGTRNTITLSNRGDFCETVQEFMPSAVSRANEWFSAGGDCDDGATLFTTLAEESAEIYAADDNRLDLVLNDGTDDFSAPGSQTYEAAGDPGFLLDMRWYAENPFADAAGKVDDVCIAGTAGFVFLDIDPFRTELDEEVGGSLELSLDGDTVTGVGNTLLRDEDRESAGDIEFEFTATKCAVDISDNQLWWLP